MTPQLKIHVDGVGSAFRTAERGVLHIEVSATFTSQADASDKVHEITESLTQAFRANAPKTEDGVAHPSAGITTFSASAISSNSYIPLNRRGNLGEEKDRKSTATTKFQVVFRDLDLLAETAAELAAMSHVSITSTQWRLTDETKAVIEREARIKAIQNAVSIAEDYANVVGRNIVAVEIKDTSVLYPAGGPFQPAPQAQAPRIMQASQQNQSSQSMESITQDGPSVQPATITATSKISVQFVSSDD